MSTSESDVSSIATGVSYAEFGTWYEAHRSAVLEPALEAASASLETILQDALSDRDLTRIRRSSGRIKSKRRAWRKLRPARREGLITTVDDIPTHVHDLVGLRLTCTNLRDIDMVQAALDNLPAPGPKRRGLCLDPTSERDYVLTPKDSGYRGWHISLSIGVEVDRVLQPIVCELQVRTLLQDSWGELTHEDTYSKDGALPPLVEILSKRMADLFATLDDIAEDLRAELDRLDEVAVAEPDAETTDSVTVDAAFEQAADAASFLHDRWTRIDRPTDLASLAWELQREFGAEVSDGWFGAGTFKRFLNDAIPDAEISTGRQRYLLPSTGDADTVDVAVPGEAEHETDTGPDEPLVPKAARQLRRIDSRFPLLSTPEWAFLFAEMAAAWKKLGHLKPTARTINQLTRNARDLAEQAGRSRSRRHLDYVAKAVLSLDDAGKPLTADAIAEAFSALTLQRMVDLRVLSSRNKKQRTAVQRWLSG